MTDDTGPALPQRADTPRTVTSGHRPRDPAGLPDIQTLRRVAAALRKLPARQQQARAAAPASPTPARGTP
jgi:hypothetical protein